MPSGVVPLSLITVIIGNAPMPDDVKPSKPLSNMTTKELSDWSKKLLSEVNDTNAELANRAESGSSKLKG